MKSNLLNAKLFLPLMGLVGDSFLESPQTRVKWQLQGSPNRNPIILSSSKDVSFRLYENHSSIDPSINSGLRSNGFTTISRNCFALSRRWKSRFGLLMIFVITILSTLTLVPGCGAGGESSGESPVAPSNRKIFVANVFGNIITVFDANDSGNVAPVRGIGSDTGLFLPSGLFVDTENNEIFVTNLDNDTITVYERTDAGNVSPKRTIGGPNTGLFGPVRIFVDTKNDEIFVINSFFDDSVDPIETFSSITVYGRLDEGNVSPKRTIEGPNTSIVVPAGIYVDTKNDELFITNQLGNTGVLVFRRTDDGDVPPQRIINISELTDEGISFFPRSLYVDVENGEILVGLSAVFSPLLPPPSNIEPIFENRINVYMRTDEGDVTPLRTIEGSNTGLNEPEGISVDGKSNEIFVSNFFNNTVTVYGRTDTGNVHPIRTLSIVDSNSAGALLDRGMLTNLFLDTENNELFVTNLNNTILVYRKTDEGEALPLRIIGANTGLLNPKWIFADTKNNEIFVSNFSSRLITTYGLTDEGNVAPLRTISQGEADQTGIFVATERNEILVNIFSLPFAITTLRRTDEGNVAALRIIGGANTRLFESEGLYVDLENNEIFVTNGADINIPGEITVYRRRDSGDVTPLRIISGQNTELLRPLGIFADAEHDELFVTNPFDDKILIYRRADDGNVSPIRTIEGPNTRLFAPLGIFVDIEQDEIFVTNAADRITVYRRTDEGNATPLRTIEGPATRLAIPWGIFVADSP
ncbi:MAG TPA: hypothetical protein VGA95_13585 [Thermodesulfobacteriota bacterium]